MSRLALHQAAMPNIFLSFFTFFLLVCFRLLCVILVFTMYIRVLLLYASKITHTYFYFFIWARLCLFLSSLGSSVIGLPFPPLGCLSVIFFVNVTCAVSCLHRRVQRPNSWCRVQILLPTMWSEILCSLSSLDFVTDGRNSIVTTTA